MHCHCGTNNRALRWTFTDPCKPEVRPGVQEESVLQIAEEWYFHFLKDLHKFAKRHFRYNPVAVPS